MPPHWEDNPNGDVYCVGNYSGDLAGVLSLVRLYKDGTVPPDRMLAIAIIFHQRDLLSAAISNFESIILRLLLDMQAHGEVKLATLFSVTQRDRKPHLPKLACSATLESAPFPSQR